MAIIFFWTNLVNGVSGGGSGKASGSSDGDIGWTEPSPGTMSEMAILQELASFSAFSVLCHANQDQALYPVSDEFQKASKGVFRFRYSRPTHEIHLSSRVGEGSYPVEPK